MAPYAKYRHQMLEGRRDLEAGAAIFTQRQAVSHKVAQQCDLTPPALHIMGQA